MKTIFKYQLDPATTERHILSMPVGATILVAQNQRERVTLWAEVEDTNPMEDREFLVCKTGQPCPTLRRKKLFLGTVQLDGGSLVLHVYELLP
jgi:hypothetical protein